MMKRIILVGAPGAGKGTQSQRLARFLHIPEVSTGEIFRTNIHEQTPLGKEAQSYISSGNLVPDDVTNRLVESYLTGNQCNDGFILDGYPRNIDQAHALEDMLIKAQWKLDAVINIHVNEKEIIDRMLKRAQIEGREDDTREVITHRIEVYHSSTEPLLTYYKEKNLLITIDGLGSIDEVWQRVQRAVE